MKLGLTPPVKYGVSLILSLLCAAAGAQDVTIATLQPGTLSNAQAQVIARVVQDNSRLQARVLGHGGDTSIIDAVNSRQADFLLLDVGEPAEAQRGENAWRGNPKPNLRVAMTLFGFQMAFWVRKNSPVQTIADLKGRNVPAEWLQQPSAVTHVSALLAAGGLSYDDVRRVPAANVIRAAEDFRANKIDLFFFAVGGSKVQEISAAVGGLRLLPLDSLPDAEARMQRVRPEYYASTVNPARHIAGVDKPSRVQTIDNIIGVGAHVPDEVVREFIRTVYNNKKALVAGHPSFAAYEPSQSGKPQARLAYHPAADRYWRETLGAKR